MSGGTERDEAGLRMNRSLAAQSADLQPRRVEALSDGVFAIAMTILTLHWQHAAAKHRLVATHLSPAVIRLGYRRTLGSAAPTRARCCRA
jgi:hypothetical protein